MNSAIARGVVTPSSGQTLSRTSSSSFNRVALSKIAPIKYSDMTDSSWATTWRQDSSESSSGRNDDILFKTKSKMPLCEDLITAQRASWRNASSHMSANGKASFSNAAATSTWLEEI